MLSRGNLRTDVAVLSDAAAFLGLATGRNGGGGKEHDARCHYAKHCGAGGGQRVLAAPSHLRMLALAGPRAEGDLAFAARRSHLRGRTQQPSLVTPLCLALLLYSRVETADSGGAKIVFLKLVEAYPG